MAKLIDTFSSNSLKILDRDLIEFEKKYIYNLSLYKKDEKATLGQNFHNIIRYYINGFDVEKMILKLDEKEKNAFEKLRDYIDRVGLDGFIETEYSFLIKDEIILNNEKKNYFLTGRYDAIYKDAAGYKNDSADGFIIYDWKTLNIPYNAQDDLQSIVYLYCASKIYKTNNIKIRYYSIEKGEFSDIEFENSEKYKKRIDGIIGKYYMHSVL